MIVYGPQLYTEIADEFWKFVTTYWYDSIENENELPLDIDYEAFDNLAKSGNLFVITGREDGVLVSAALYFLFNNLKRKTEYTAQCDTFAVRLDRRGMGIGKDMYEASQVYLSGLGVTRIINSYRSVYDALPLFEKCGARLEELVYFKRIG